LHNTLTDNLHYQSDKSRFYLEKEEKRASGLIFPERFMSASKSCMQNDFAVRKALYD